MSISCTPWTLEVHSKIIISSNGVKKRLKPISWLLTNSWTWLLKRLNFLRTLHFSLANIISWSFTEKNLTNHFTSLASFWQLWPPLDCSDPSEHSSLDQQWWLNGHTLRSDKRSWWRHCMVMRYEPGGDYWGLGGTFVPSGKGHEILNPHCSDINSPPPVVWHIPSILTPPPL